MEQTHAAVDRPPWANLIDENNHVWRWHDTILVHANAIDEGRQFMQPVARDAKSFFVRFIYADQNRCRRVRLAIDRALSQLGTDDWGLNLGAGSMRPHPRMINMDLVRTPGIDIVTNGSILPFRNNTLKVVIAQEVLEHIAEYQKTIDEVNRCLVAGGIFYCQVPFQIGHHHGPHDYWRFSHEGLRHLFSDGRWDINELSITLGYGSGFYRILIEFLAVTASLIWSRLYMPVKAGAALLFWPLKLLDPLTEHTDQMHRIAAGYLIAASKRLPQTVVENGCKPPLPPSA